MKSTHLAAVAALSGLLALNSGPAWAQAPAESPTPPATVASADGASQLARYTAAHDSLMRLVANVYAQAEARLSFFKNAQGSFGGLHRQVRDYSTRPSAATNYDDQSTGKYGLVKKQVIKHCFGIELEKVTYYDGQQRIVLKERYEAHRLTRLELFEYKTLFNSPSASWLFLRGDYVRHLSAPNSLTFKSTRRESYFFKPLPPGE